MIKTTLEIDDMVCSMCEAHINETIRKACPVKKVSSSHNTGRAEILSENPLDEESLRTAIEATGYHVRSIRSVPYEKKGLFHFRR